MKPGDKLWIVRDRNFAGSEIEVLSVGRKWAKVENGRWRVNIDTRRVYDGDHAVGTAYDIEADYRGEIELQDAWSEFLRMANRRKTAKGLTLKQIAEATAWLGVGE